MATYKNLFLLFQVMNSQYTFDPVYLTCISKHMADVKPFGDVPIKMASSVKRSMVATRTLVKALRSGHAIADNVKKVIHKPVKGAFIKDVTQ